MSRGAGGRGDHPTRPADRSQQHSDRNTRWLEDCKRVDLVQVAAELGIGRQRGTHIGPCPGCGESARSSTDRRPGPVFLTQRYTRWRCGRCDAHGDGPDLVRLALGVDWSEVRAWYASRGWCEPAAERTAAGWPPVERVEPRPLPAPPPSRHPSLEVLRDVWDRCRPVGDDPEVAAWLRSRGIDPSEVEDRCLARALPAERGPWWSWYSRGFRCVFGLVDETGELVTLRARRIAGDEGPKVMALADAPPAVLADGTAWALLRGDAWLEEARVRRVYVTEGEPDWLKCATWVGEADSAPAVVGIPGADAWPGWLSSRIPDGWTVVVAAHDDEGGRRLLARIAAEIGARCTVERVAARGDA